MGDKPKHKDRGQKRNPNKSRKRPKFEERQKKGPASYHDENFEYKRLPDIIFQKKSKRDDKMKTKTAQAAEEKYEPVIEGPTTEELEVYDIPELKEIKPEKKGENGGKNNKGDRKTKSSLKGVYKGKRIHCSEDEGSLIFYLNDGGNGETVILEKYNSNDFDFEKYRYYADINVSFNRRGKLVGDILGKTWMKPRYK